MNKKIPFSIFLLILFIIGLGVIQHFAASNVKNDAIEENDILNIVEFATDKETYSSQEEMIVSLIVTSSDNIEQAVIKLTGIKPYNNAYIDDSKIVDLEKGKNEIIFKEKTPYCTSGCGGVYPGPYNLDIKIFVKETLIVDSTVTINLVGD